MRRRDLLASAGMLAAGGTAGFPTPAISQGVRELRMVTDWPEGPGMLPSSRRLADAVSNATGGRIRIKVFASGALVRPFETFDAVQAGIADMFHTHIGYFDKKSPALHFFSGVPFGLTANELFAWVRFGGGQALWDELGRQFDIKPLHCASTGTQMGGWFRKEITALEDFRGLRYRMAEPGAEVLRRLGAVVVVLPGAEIVPALKSGAIDAAEWVGPWPDMAAGLNEAASYYYYPAWQEPSAVLALGVNRDLWESFDESDRKIIEAAAAGEFAVTLAEFNTNNALALRELRQQGTVEIKSFDDAILGKLRAVSEDVVAEAGAGDSLSRKIYASFREFRSLISGWTDIGEGAYINTRRRT